MKKASFYIMGISKNLFRNKHVVRLRLRQPQPDRSPCHFELAEKLPKPHWIIVSLNCSLRHAQADMVFRDALILLLFPALLFTACNNNKEKSTDSMPGMDMSGTEITRVPDTTNLTKDASLEPLLQPTDEYIVSSAAVTSLQKADQEMQLNALGTINYDNRQLGSISSRISGRIEKLYVRYRYQFINKGQRVLDIYSPELLTSQQNLIFLLRNDPSNHSFINAARQRLQLLGMSGQQIAEISRTGKPLYSVAVFSNYSGYVTERGFDNNVSNSLRNTAQSGNADAMASTSLTTSELPVKEGMYLEKGQQIFTVINASKGLISLSIFSDQQNLIKKGTPVVITPETAPDKKIKGTIDWIEPFYSSGSKTLSARVYFNNAILKLPIGSPVQATIFISSQSFNWLPSTSIITTGLKNIVFKKEGNGFRAYTITTGIRTADKVQVISGVLAKDSVALNAQHLIGSESTIKIK